MLYSLVHAIGRTAGSGSVDEIFAYLKRSFQFTDAKHEDLLATVRQRTVLHIQLLIT